MDRAVWSRATVTVDDVELYSLVQVVVGPVHRVWRVRVWARDGARLADVPVSSSVRDRATLTLLVDGVEWVVVREGGCGC